MTGDPATPTAAVRAAIAALDAEDWPGAARLCDPTSLVVFHRHLVERLAPAEPLPELSADDYLQFVPQLPRELAEFVSAEHRRQSDSASALARELADVPTPQALRALTPEEAFARWLAGHARRHQLEQFATDGRAPRHVVERQLAAPAPPFHRVVLGAVDDGPAVAHVLYRRDPPHPAAWHEVLDARDAELTPGEQEFVRDIRPRRKPSVATCRRQPDGRWLVVAEHRFLGHDTVAYEVAAEIGGGGAPAPDA